MAYQVRQKDPLLETAMQEAIQRRGKEMLGLILLALAVALALALGSYSPEDPSWLSATDQPVRNWLGPVGAALASPLMVTIGWASWGIVAIAFGWGVRFFLHLGEGRLFSRIIFAPIPVAVAAIYASTLAPPAFWPHSFGMGGLFGDTTLAALLQLLPLPLVTALRLVAGLTALAGVGLFLFVLGFDRAEGRRIGTFLLYGIVLAYASVAAFVGLVLRQGLRAPVRLLQLWQARRKAAREVRATRATAPSGPAETVTRPAGTPPPEIAPGPAGPAPAAQPGAPAAGSLRPVPPLTSGPSELVTPEPPARDVPPPSDERVRLRILDVIRRRRAAPPPPADDPAPRITPPLTASAARQPAPPPAAGTDTAPPAPPVPPVSPLATTRHGAAPDPAAGTAVRRPAPGPARTSRMAEERAQPRLELEGPPAYDYPPLSLLADPASIERRYPSREELEANARLLESVLDDYGVKGEITHVAAGPVVTMYELEPAPGLKASRVIGLADDIARSMSALSARVSTVPGRSIIGIELPNAHREKVLLREILASREYGDTRQKLPLALGKNIAGEPVVASLARMPHLLIAGTTGSGKSVAINTMILSLLYKLRPDECRLIMIDPKMLELSVYDGIPHLLSPVVTDPKKAVVALKWVVAEMEERYRKMSKMGVRNIDGYNARVADALSRGEMFTRTVQTGFDEETGDPVFETEEFAPEKMPYIVVVVDEMADLMMVAGKEIEACIQRLAQMARASGIHLIMATQRPSVDVITGTIKANFPTRISFQVSSKIDSRTILGEQGAEQLLGMGDMLYMAGGSKITRVHGPFVSDEEVEAVVTHLKSLGEPDYVSGVVEGPDEAVESSIDQVLGLGGNTTAQDALYDQAVAIVLKDRKCSTSYIQRKLAIGYNKAARLVEQMEEAGLVSPANHVGKREVLVPEGQGT